MSDSIKEKHILIVEDHPLVAIAIKMFLSKIDSSLVFTLCNCARSAISEFHRSSSWHRLFLDLDVPGAYGLSLARQFEELGVADRCAVITGVDNPQWKAEIREMGMLGYIDKITPIEDFASLLESVLNGRSVFRNPSMNRPPTNMPMSQQPTRAVHLTRRHHDILDLLHRGYSSKKIAAQLGLRIGTIDNHVTGLMRALSVTSRSHAIVKAIELGHLKIPDTARTL